ncbi:MAG TPA: RHS repeat-associated core domain-containing protein, partial [Pyrinomonadaceae bacterium]|nr:RHS repeat-associated core domain-containing protein [Pyrinomonadaceae bacterium]
AFFDAENHITAVQDKLGGWSNYSYNADGQRTRRKINNQEMWQIYGFDGELLAEYAATAAAAAPQKEYGYRNGQLLVTTALDTIWSDDAVPAGAAVAGDGESWNWVSSNPGSFSGSTAHQSNIVAGLHQHYFYGATTTLSVSAGDKLVAYVYLDPSNVPSQIMLQWNDGSWEHRAYWGANNLPWGIDGTNSRRYMGPLPAAGSWVRLEIPANLVGLEGHTLNGMAFSMWGGRATWDRAGKSSSSASINWLMSDHLGTPRMVFDQSGTQANVKRHDYLPFGEELFAGTGGRTVAQGYAALDPVRQQFTAQERDVETGLDYFKARYFSSAQGRFTSPDPLLASAETENPKSWNRYAYVLNNPTRLIDPNGLDDADTVEAEEQRKRQQQKQQQGQVVDLRKDSKIVAEVKQIKDTATPLSEGEMPVLSGVRVVVGETSVVNNGTVINGYGDEMTNFTGVVRPVAYIPVDQRGNIIEGNGVAIVETVNLVRGDPPIVSDNPAPTPPGGVFIDVQSLPNGKPITEINQQVFVAQLSRTTGTPSIVYRTGVNNVIKDAKAKTVSVKLGPTLKVK